MASPFSVIQSIAEERIREALELGAFDDLPGRGRPLRLADESGVPEELRMALHVLKNAGYVPPEVAERKEIASLAEALEKNSDERTRVEQMRRLEVLIYRVKTRDGRNLAVHAADDVYLDRILDKLAAHKKARTDAK